MRFKSGFESRETVAV